MPIPDSCLSFMASRVKMICSRFTAEWLENKSKNDHAYKIAYLKCTLNLNSNSKNEAFSLIINISRVNEGQSWYLTALFWKYYL